MKDCLSVGEIAATNFLPALGNRVLNYGVQRAGYALDTAPGLNVAVKTASPS